MQEKSSLDSEYTKVVKDNPDKKFFLYLRNHPDDESETIFISKLVQLFGKCKEVPNERITIFIVDGKRVFEFIDMLNESGTSLYLSYIQSKEEIIN